MYIYKGSYLLREVDSCSMFLLPFYNSSSWHFPGSCHPRIFEQVMCINVFKYQCTPVILRGQSKKCTYTALLPVAVAMENYTVYTFQKIAWLGERRELDQYNVDSREKQKDMHFNGTFSSVFCFLFLLVMTG